MARRSSALLFLPFAACAAPARSPALPPALSLAPPPEPARAEPAALPEPAHEEAKAPALPEPPTAIVAPAPRLTSRGYVTWIYAHPRTTERFIGYVRNGSSVALRGTELVAGEGCPRGFYAVEPRGFVCNDRTVTRAPSSRAQETAAAAAGVSGPLPYRHAFSDGAPMYNRIPRVEEQRRVERAFGPAGGERRPYERPSAYHDLAGLAAIPPVDPVPPFLAGGGTAAEGRMGLVKETLPAGAIVSFTRAFAAEGRTWLLSADQSLVPADRVRIFAPSTFHGVRLGGEVRLPLAWVRGTARPKLRRLPSGAFTEAGEAWPVRSFIRLGGARVAQDGRGYLETLERDADGAMIFVRDDEVTVAERAPKLPTGVKPGQKWIDVSITRGTLVAYEGLEPVYATLMSPGRGGVPVPGRDNVADSTTPTGTYNITFKDRAVTMSPDLPGGPRTHYIADVPHVQYFKAPFALHAAFWHERFGEPASAGCVNVSPVDAEALFQWTDPEVPEGWQGATGAGAPGGGKTTAVVVRR